MLTRCQCNNNKSPIDDIYEVLKQDEQLDWLSLELFTRVQYSILKVQVVLATAVRRKVPFEGTSGAAASTQRKGLKNRHLLASYQGF